MRKNTLPRGRNTGLDQLARWSEVRAASKQAARLLQSAVNWLITDAAYYLAVRRYKRTDNSQRLKKTTQLLPGAFRKAIR